MVYIASKYDTVKVRPGNTAIRKQRLRKPFAQAGREDEPEGAGRLTGVVRNSNS